MSTYQDIRNKTIGWCRGLLENKIYTQEQYNECAKGFVDMGVGELPPNMDPPKTNNEYSYSLYDRNTNYTQTQITSSSSGKIMIKASNGKLLMAKENGDLSLTTGKNIDNQKELEWRINFQKDDQYTILSHYGKFLSVNTVKKSTPNSSNIQSTTLQDQNVPIADKETLVPSSIWIIDKVDDRIIIESSKYKGNKLSGTSPVSLTKGRAEMHYWLIVDIPSASKSVMPVYNPIDKHNEKNILLNDFQALLKQKFTALIEIKMLFDIGKALEDQYCRIIKNVKINIEKTNQEFNKKVNQQIPVSRIPNSSNRIYREEIDRLFSDAEFSNYLKNFYIPDRDQYNRPISRLDLRRYAIFNVVPDVNYGEDFPIKTLSSVCNSQIGRLFPALKMILDEKKQHSITLNNAVQTAYNNFKKISDDTNDKLNELIAFENSLQNQINNNKNRIVNNNIVLERKGNKISRVENKNRKLTYENDNITRQQGLSEVNSIKIQETTTNNKYKLYILIISIGITMFLIIYISYTLISN